VVATPIGNLEDITFRAVRTLREVPVIAAEDTRVTRNLLNHFEIKTPLVSFHEFTNPAKRGRLVERLESGDLAMVSDAGMPGISDPGFPLIRDALAAGHKVEVIPGPSATLTALVASGLPTHEFSFLGFLPRTTAQRRSFFRKHADGPTFVVFESPHRFVKALEDLVAELGPDRPAAAARELTKKFEEIVRGSAREVLEHFKAHAPRGEFTLVVGPPAKERSA
jgi:16S rRNA (cytidine1402-2'-O)-methyltransferase